MQKPVETKRVVSWRSGAAHAFLDHVAVEEPLEIRVDTRPLTVTMRTPGHDRELAAGLLFSEGVVRRTGDVRSIRGNPRDAHGNVLEIFLAEGATVAWERLARRGLTVSSCGICGKLSVSSVTRKLRRIPDAGRRFSRRMLEGLPGAMRRRQEGFDRSGGLHAAALFDFRGRLLALREDVGRHNAVDKVIGFGFLEGHLPLDRHILVVSGRASFEIVQKALAAGIPVVCAVSAPSSLAVDLARSGGQTLIGFHRGESFNVYSCSSRLRA